MQSPFHLFGKNSGQIAKEAGGFVDQLVGKGFATHRTYQARGAAEAIVTDVPLCFSLVWLL